MCFSERSMPWLFFTSPLKKNKPKPKTQVNVSNLVIELLGIIYSSKHLKKCIEIKACGNTSHPLVTSAEFIM